MNTIPFIFFFRELISVYRWAKCLRCYAVFTVAGGVIFLVQQATAADVLYLSLATNVVTEGGRIQATVSRDSATTAALTVLLFGSDPTELNVPPHVTISAGERSTNFLVETVNDGNVDGPQSTTITADADGFLPANDTVIVTDDDTLSQRTIGGKLFGELDADNYWVTEDLMVESGRSFVIHAPSTLFFGNGRSLTNAGCLLAQGAGTSHIRFTSAISTPNKGYWKGITVTSSGAPQTILDNVEIAFAQTGLNVRPEGDAVNLILANSSVHNSSQEGVRVHAREGINIGPGAVMIISNRVFQNDQAGIYVSCHVDGCTASRNAAHIIGNDVFHNGTDGFDLNADGSESLGCRSVRRGTLNGLIANNYVHGNGRYGMWCKSDKGFLKTIGRFALTIQNNLIVNNIKGGFWINGDSGELLPKFLNNTVVANGGAGFSHDVNVTQGFAIQNNLVIGNDLGIEARSVFTPTNAALASITHNDVWSNGNSNWVNYPMEYGRLIDTNRNGTSVDHAGNFSADPQFLGPKDFHLHPLSPAVDAGTVYSMAVTDIEEHPRRDYPDVGCYEAVNVALTPPTFQDGLPVALSISGGRGTSGWIEASTNLFDWFQVKHFALSNRFQETEITLPIDTRQAFFRARTRPGQELGVNLIRNGDAEGGSGSSDGSKVSDIPDWRATGNFTVVRYGANPGPPPAFPAPIDPGPEIRGLNFFSGGPNNAASSATQTLDLSGYSDLIDASTLTFELTGYFGGFQKQEDSVSLTALFQDASASSLKTVILGPVFSSERLGETALLWRSAIGTVPTGTRHILLTLAMERKTSSYNDGYADNLSFILRLH